MFESYTLLYDDIKTFFTDICINGDVAIYSLLCDLLWQEIQAIDRAMKKMKFGQGVDCEASLL